MDLDRARVIADVGQVIVNTAKLEIDYLKVTGQSSASFLEEPPTPSVAHLGNEGQSTLQTLPGPGNGITSITRHRQGR